VCVCVYVCVYVCMYVCVCVCMCVCLIVCVQLCENNCVFNCVIQKPQQWGTLSLSWDAVPQEKKCFVYTHTHTHTPPCVYVCVCVCIYIYIHIYIHIFTGLYHYCYYTIWNRIPVLRKSNTVFAVCDPEYLRMATPFNNNGPGFYWGWLNK